MAADEDRRRKGRALEADAKQERPARDKQQRPPADKGSPAAIDRGGDPEQILGGRDK